MSKKTFMAAIIISTLLISVLAEGSIVSAQDSSTSQPVEPLVSVNLDYAFVEGNSATFALNVTRLSDFGSNSSITLVDVYCINTYIDGYLVGCLGLAFFSNGNLPMGGTGGPNIMDIVISVPAVNSETASPPAVVGQSAVQDYSETLRTGALGMQLETPPPTMGNNSVMVEYVSSETFNRTMQLNYASNYETVAQVELASSNGGYLYNAIYPSPSSTSALTPTLTQTASATPTPILSTPSNSPTPTANSTFTAGLSESASALNFGDRVNFTVTVEGGKEPYTYAWYLDNQLAETNTSPYFVTDNQAVGSHHVYVEVSDAENNSATTLTVEFNVIPTSSSPTAITTESPIITPSSTPTQKPTIEHNPTPNNTQENSMSILIIAALVVAIVVVALLVYSRRTKKQKS